MVVRLAFLLAALFVVACESPPPVVAGVRVERVFASATLSTECTLASPLRGLDDDIIVAAGGALHGVDRLTGAQRWEAELPAAAGQAAFITATPAIVADRLAVVAYHTTASDLTSRDVTTDRIAQRVAVVDLATHGVSPDFPAIDLVATLPGTAGEVVFQPAQQLIRPQVVVGRGPGDTLGRAYITAGNARDLQPWRGWIFEIDLDAWRETGDPGLKGLATTSESDCGPAGASGSRTRICGGGLWAPSGPLVRRVGDTDELIVAPGNGQLDLARADYANTLLRVRRGLAFSPGCDAPACAESSTTDPTAACVETCSDVWVPRLAPGQRILHTDNGVCNGLEKQLDCWAALDFQGGSTPIEVPLPSGKRPLLYPTKDGHAYLVDGEHLGTQHDDLELVPVCGAPGDPCQLDWAGMIVTQPALVNGIAAVPTFMPDRTHEAGVFGLVVEERPEGPRLAIQWRFPVAGSEAARQRFRRHPSRPVAVSVGGLATFWLVETTASGSGHLLGLRAADGALLADQTLVGPGFRFTLPLADDGVLYVPSCGSDRGPGTLEAYRLIAE